MASLKVVESVATDSDVSTAHISKEQPNMAKMSTIITTVFFALACVLAGVCDLIFVHFWAVQSIKGFPLFGRWITFGLTLTFASLIVLAVTLVFWLYIDRLITED